MRERTEENDEMCCRTYLSKAEGHLTVKAVTALKALQLVDDLYQLLLTKP